MELDDAYANAAHIPDGETFPPRWAAAAAAFRDKMQDAGRARLGLAYGPSPRNKLDLFLPVAAPEGLLVFVHGGYWLRFDRSFWSHFAAGALARGYAVALPSYDLCPTVDLPEITRQVASAVSFAATEIPAGPVRLTGHSAGGQLVARMTAKDVLPGIVADRLHHVLPISPVADLRPLMRTSMNADLKIDDEIAAAESPVLHPAPDVAVSIFVGAAERPALVEQSQALAKAWGCSCTLQSGLHHFDIIDGLLTPDSMMMRALFETD